MRGQRSGYAKVAAQAEAEPEQMDRTGVLAAWSSRRARRPETGDALPRSLFYVAHNEPGISRQAGANDDAAQMKGWLDCRQIAPHTLT
jgi:hypothetical protein